MGKNTNNYSQPRGIYTMNSWLDRMVVALYVVGLLVSSAGLIWTMTTKPWRSGDYYAIGVIGPWLAGLLLIGSAQLLAILSVIKQNKE